MVTGKQNRQDPDCKTTIKHKMITKCQGTKHFRLIREHVGMHNAHTHTHTHTLNNHT